jgi:hypothetical protein
VQDLVQKIDSYRADQAKNTKKLEQASKKADCAETYKYFLKNKVIGERGDRGGEVKFLDSVLNVTRKLKLQRLNCCKH